MKAELINTMQIFFILMFLVGIITYAITYFKNRIKKFNYNFIKRIYTKSLDYSRLMKIKDYISYEKYDIWRYCVQF
jgi:ABC-type multidrug transport system fused ATPase/permease subunit